MDEFLIDLENPEDVFSTLIASACFHDIVLGNALPVEMVEMMDIPERKKDYK